MLGSGPSKVAFDNHLLLMINVRIIQSILEVFPEPVASLNLRVQPSLSAGLYGGLPRCRSSYEESVWLRVWLRQALFRCIL